MPEDFYVKETECMACGAPPAAAPDLMGLDEHGTKYTYCYFKRQPVGEYEIAQAIAAINESCCGAVCYRGSNTEILALLGRDPDDTPLPPNQQLRAFSSQQVNSPIISAPPPTLLERIKKALI